MNDLNQLQLNIIRVEAQEIQHSMKILTEMK